jgi:hypothetical protein
MFKSLFCSVIFLAIATSAYAQSYDDEEDRATHAKTVKEFVAACPKDHAPCHDLIATVFIMTSEPICIPPGQALSTYADYDRVFLWLKSHPTPAIQNAEPATGIIWALESVFPCKK